MTLSKYKQSVVKALVENESNGLPDYSQQVQQAVGRNIQPTFIAPVQPLPSQPQPLIQPKQEIRPMTAVAPLDEISDFTSGYTSPVKPIAPVQNIAQKPQESPITDFTPQVDDNKFVSTNKDIKGGVDTLDEASYLFERLGNTIGTWVNQVPAFLGTVGLKKDQTSQYTTPEEQKAQLEKLGMDTSKLPENYTKSLAETTNKPYQQQFWEDVIKYEVVKDRSQEINQKYEGQIDDFTKFAGDVSTGALDMLPQTALAYLSGGTSAMAYVFAKSASQSTKQAVSLGAEPEQAKTYGLVMGAIEVGTEMISGGWAGAPKGMGWASKGVMDTVQEQVLKFAKTDLSKKVIDMGMEYLGEGFEEYMSEVLGNYANKIIDQDVKSFGKIQKDAFYAGLVGTFTAMFSQMGQIATVKVAENVVKNDVTTFESLPKEQQLEYAKSVLDKTNTNIVFADNFEGQEVKGEGMFTVKDGQKTIVLPTRMETDKNNLLTVSLMHEFTHTLEQNGEYDNFKSMVIDNLEQTGILDMLRENKKSLYKDENLTDDEIDQEIVATFVQDNIFKRVGKVDGEITTYTDPLAFRKFMKDMGKQDYNSFKKLVNGFLNAYYKGEMTEQYDSLVKQYNKADVNQKPEIAKQMSQLIQQIDLTNPSITKSMEFAFNELANSVQGEVSEQSKFMKKENKVDEPKPVERFAEPTLEELNAPETETRSVPLTTLESGVLTEEQATNLRTQIEQGKFKYEPFGDKRALAYADGKVKSNPEQAYQDFKSSYENNRTMNKNDIAVAERLIKHFADTNNIAQVEELIGMVADIGTQLGQQVQALSLIKKMSPAGQAMAIEKVVNRIEESYRGTKLEQTTDYAMPEVKTPSIEAKQAIKEFSGEKDKVTNWNGDNVSDIQKSINKIAKKRQVEGTAVLIDQTLVDNLKNATEETRPEAVNAIKADAKKKLNNVIKSLGKLQKTYEGKKIDLTIDPALKEELLSAKNQDEIDAVVEKIKEDVASRLPSTLGDRLQAWRFLSMLGNLKTHIRNIVSNATFGTTAKIKDKIALAIEQGFIKPEDRTKALNVKKGIKNFANATFEKQVNEITATGKYDMTRDIESRKKVFDTKLLENARIKNSNVLEKEDIIAMRGAFTDVLGQFMTARNYDPKTITDDQLQKAIEYASEQAKIRTFRQYSKTASMLNQIEKTNAFTKVLIGSLVPFKKTPINILKTGFEYSPAGLAMNIPYGIIQVKKGVENGGWTPTQFVDKISAGLTGSGIALLGAALFNMGILSVGDDDEKSKKETNFDSSLGKQRYSLNLGEYSVSLDWLSPAVMPLMVGAEMAKWWKQDKGNNIIDESAEALANIFNPAFDLTMLQGVSDTFKSFESAGSSQIGDILTTVLANYSTQFFPTVGGQIAKTIDPNVRSTYAGSGLSGTIDTTINKIKNKIPFLSMQNEPVINVKGQEVLQVGGKDNSVGNVVIRSIQNFLNPANIKENIASETDSEIMKVFKQTGDTSVIPSLAPSSFTYDGQKIDLQGEDKTNYAKNMGTVAYNALNEVFDSKLYDGLTDEMKSDVIKDTLTYASSVAKNKALGGNFVNTSLQNMSEAEDNGVSISEYLIMNSKLDTIKSTEDFTRKEQFIADLVYAGYTDDEIYRYLVYVGDYSYDKSDQKYIDTLRSVE